MERRNRLSPAGRLRCAESGRANIARLLEVRAAAAPGTRAASSAFQAALVAEIGGTPSAAQQGLILAATASYTALHIVLAKLLAARRFKRVEVLIEKVAPLQSALQRTLRALGFASDAPEDGDSDAPTRGGIADYLAGRTVAQEVTDDGRS